MADRTNHEINWVTDDDGKVIGYDIIPGTRILFPVFDTSGNQAVGGSLTVTGHVLTESGLGTPATGVTAVERGDGVQHQTLLTLTNVPVEIVSVSTGAGIGGAEIYAFPKGMIDFRGCMADLSLSIAVAKRGDFTDGTPAGDIGVGTVAIANDDAFGTDATDDDLATASAFTMTDYAAADLAMKSEPSAHLDGTSAAAKAYVNLLVDAGDIDDDVTTQILVSGTVRLTWALL